MTSSSSASPVPAIPPSAALLGLTQGSVITQALAVVAELRVADELAGGPLTAVELAGRVDADAGALFRLLRLLASYGVFTQADDGRFHSTPLSDAMCEDAPGSVRNLALLMGHPAYWDEWSHLGHSVRTGEPSVPKFRGMGAFEYFEANPDLGGAFMAAMGSLSEQETAPLVDAYDFSVHDTIVDVGGGRGALLAGILAATPDARGVLFDERAEQSGAQAVLDEAGVADRCTIQAGGLFDPVPADADAYLLKHIVHDWPEAQALEILRHVRQGINAEGRLLIAEFVPPAQGDEPHPGKLFDIWLMLLVGGKERTADQYAELLAQAGFELERVIPTASPLSIVEGRPV